MKDGFILFYSKDNEVLPVAVNDEDLQRLNGLIPAIFNGRTPKVMGNLSQGKVENLVKKEADNK